MPLFNKPDDPAVDDGNELYLTLEPAEPPISLVTIAGELGEPIDALAFRVADDVFLEARSGLRCVSVATCRRLIDERDELAAEHAAIAERNAANTRAIAEQHRSPGRGVPAIEGASAVEAMLANGEEPEWKRQRVSVAQEFLDSIGRDR